MEDNAPILAPVIALVLWTMVIWLWMYVTRIPAMQNADIPQDRMTGMTPGYLDEILPANIQWKAHNYNHLLEQPTVFYAVALTLALIGAGDGTNLILAWTYVGIRIVHSLVQVTINKVMLRFLLFLVASIALIWLTINAALLVF